MTPLLIIQEIVGKCKNTKLYLVFFVW